MTNLSMTNDERMSNKQIKQTKYDLEERTAIFAEKIISLVKKIHMNPITKPLVSQIIRSATSVAANYCEANDAFSRKDFTHKISICRKEAKETKYWLRIIANTCPYLKDNIATCKQEAHELNLIFSTIINTMRTPK